MVDKNSRFRHCVLPPGVGSLAYFSLEEESGESSNQEEDDTDGVESEDNDGDEVGLLNEPLERRTTAGGTQM